MQKLIPVLFLAIFAFASCSKSDDDVAAKAATWNVTLYQVPGTDIATKEDKTALFSGYAFEFNDDNKMVVHMPNGSLIDAKWSADASAAAFGIENAVSPLDAITGSWDVIEQTDTVLKLEGKIDASSAANYGKVLHFAKQ